MTSHWMDQPRDKFGRLTDDGSDGMPSRSEITQMIIRRMGGKDPVLPKYKDRIAQVANQVGDAPGDGRVAELYPQKMESLKKTKPYEWADKRAEERGKGTEKYNNGINKDFNNEIAKEEGSTDAEKRRDMLNNNLLKDKEGKKIEATEVVGGGYGACSGKLDLNKSEYEYQALGRYQIRKGGLIDIKWMDEKKNWTQEAKDNGVSNYHDFLSNPEIQEKAFRKYMERIEEQTRSKGSEAFVGKKVVNPFDNNASIEISYAGLMAAAHRQGAGATREVLEEVVNKYGGNPPIEFWNATEVGRNPDKTKEIAEKRKSILTRLKKFKNIHYEKTSKK